MHGQQNIKRPYIVILDKIFKTACLMDVEILNSHNLHSTITKKLQSYTDLKEELIRIWQRTTAYVVPTAPSTTGITPKVNEILKPLNLRPALNILTQKAVTIHSV